MAIPDLPRPVRAQPYQGGECARNTVSLGKPKTWSCLLNLDEVLRFVGVTGLPGSGKGAFIELLRPMLESHGVATRYYSLSDELRDEARRRALEVSRPVLRAIANELRLVHGSGVLSLLVVNKVRHDLGLIPAGQPLVVIIDAIRNPEEVAFLQRELAPQFDLVAVDAPLDTLVNRIAARARYDEPDEFVRQKEAARRMILGEAGKDEPAHGHDIVTCMGMADWKVDNSTSLAVLSQETEAYIAARIPLPASR